MKYKLTNNTKKIGNTTLYQIEALKDFDDVQKGDLGGWIEKESNLSQEGDCWVYGDAQLSGNAVVYGDARVSGNAVVYGDAWVYGDARLCGDYNYTKGWFIGGDDSCKITNITDKTGTSFWEAQYVLGDYEITPIEPKIIEVNGKKYKLIEK